MRILCLIMVGAFLLTIAIAENGDAQRVNGRPQSSMYVPRSLSHSRNIPWSMRRAAESSQSFTPSNGVIMPDNVALPATSVPQYYGHREHKSEGPAEGSMILEPMHPRSSRPKWMDWIPDFFDDDPPSGPGPLIGPIDFPGLSRNLYIRQNEPLDDDTNHVVIHVINRQAQSHPPTTPSLAQLPLGNNQIAYSYSNSNQHTGSLYSTPVKSPEIESETAQFPYKLAEGNPWKLQSHTSDDKEIKDKKSQYPFFDAPTEISNEKFRQPFSATPKPVGNPRPSIAWSQRFDGQPIVIGGGRAGQHYGRSIDSKAPVMFPAPNSTATTPTKQDQSYAWHRKYGYQNNTKVASENVRAATASLRAKLAEITAANRRQVNRINNASSRVSRTSDTPSRLPRNRFSHYDKVNDTEKSLVNIKEPSVLDVKDIGIDLVTREVSPRHTRDYSPQFAGDNETQRSPVYIHKPSASEDEGALEVVNAPELKNTTDKSTGEKKEDVMQNIMSMTASQQWENVTSNLIETEKILSEPMEAERRMDIVTDEDDEEETKESTTTTTTTTSTSTTTTTVAPPVSTTNKTNKSKPNMQEAVERMMSSFTQWRYKVVSTNFLKELDGMEENESKHDR